MMLHILSIYTSAQFQDFSDYYLLYDLNKIVVSELI